MSQKILGAVALGNGEENLSLEAKNFINQEKALLQRLGIQDSAIREENLQQAVHLVQWLDNELEHHPTPEILRIVEMTQRALHLQKTDLKTLLGKSGREISRDIQVKQQNGNFRFGQMLAELNEKILAQNQVKPAEVGYLRIKHQTIEQINAAYTLIQQQHSLEKLKQSSFDMQRFQMIESFLADTATKAGTNVIFENGQEIGFEKGLQDMLQVLAEQSGSKEVLLDLDVQGDGKSYVFHKSTSLDSVDDFERDAVLLPISQPISFSNSHEEALVGNLTFHAAELDHNLQAILRLGAEKIGAYVCQWRKDFATEKKGFPPRVVSLRKQGRLVEQSEEELTMFYCDIYGFTRISEQFNKLKKYGLKSGKLLALIENFEAKHKEFLGDIGCYDKLVGDCVIAHFGPPYEFDRATGKKFDAFGLSESERNPGLYAMSALMMAMNVRKKLAEIQDYFQELLYESALEIEQLKPLGKKKALARQGKTPEEIKAMVLADFTAKTKFQAKLQVTQGFSTGFANVGLMQSAEGNEKINYSNSYTVIGDEMNLAARLQSAAKPHEMIINMRTKELLEQAMAESLAVPMAVGGKTQTWQEFAQVYLGEKAETHDLKLDFEPTMLDLKNKEGFEVACRLTIHAVPKEVLVSEGFQKITEEEFAKKDGKYVISTENNNEDVVVYYLENYFNRNEKYEVALSRSAVENRYIPQEDYDDWQSDEKNCDDQVQVYNGKITVVNFLSIEKMIDEQIGKMDTGKESYEVNEVPHTLYQIVNIHQPDAKNDDVEIEVKKGKHTFWVKVDAENVQRLSGIQNPSSAHRFLDISTFPWVKKFQDADQKRRLLSHPVFASPLFFFLHVTGAYVGTLPDLENLDTAKKTDLTQWFPAFSDDVDSSGKSLVPKSLK